MQQYLCFCTVILGTFILRVVCLLWYVLLQHCLVSEILHIRTHVRTYIHFSVGFLTFFIHFKHTKALVENVHFRICNYVSFCLGLLAGIGLLLIASFQVIINAHDCSVCTCVCNLNCRIYSNKAQAFISFRATETQAFKQEKSLKDQRDTFISYIPSAYDLDSGRRLLFEEIPLFEEILLFEEIR